MYNQNGGYSGYNQDAAGNFTSVIPRRPTSITVACIVITLVLVVNLLTLLSLTADTSLSIPVWYWVLTIGQFSLIVAAIVGLWLMRKWGAYAYTLNFVITLILLLQAFNIILLILPVVLLVFIYRKFNEMR